MRPRHRCMAGPQQLVAELNGAEDDAGAEEAQPEAAKVAIVKGWRKG